MRPLVLVVQVSERRFLAKMAVITRFVELSELFVEASVELVASASSLHTVITQ